MARAPSKLSDKAGPSRKRQGLIAAAERGAGEAAQELGDRYREERGVKADLSPSTRANRQRRQIFFVR
jgi:hypothetical protein